MVVRFLPIMMLFSITAQAQPSLHEQSQLLGNPLRLLHEGVAEIGKVGATGADDTGMVGGAQKLGHETSVQILGHKVDVMKFGVETSVPSANGATVSNAENKPAPTNSAPNSTAPQSVILNQHDLYIGGIRVWNGNVHYDQGALYYSGGIAPTQIPVPLFVYPLGPVLLEVDAGIEFEGLAQAKLAVGPSLPIKDSTVHADVTVDLYAAAYTEAYARLLFVKAGIGGRINVIDASAGFHSVFYLNGMKPRTNNYGYATIFSGQVYGYVDTNLLFGRWNRLLQRNFFNLRGKSFNFYPSVGNIKW